jgi:hypothetical protein
MITVLIIDSDAATRLSARRVLERAGFAVREAASAESPLSFRPRLIIVNVAAACRTAIGRRYPRARILAIGRAHGLRPPFTPSQLLAAVRRCLAAASFNSTGATTGSRRR